MPFPQEFKEDNSFVFKILILKCSQIKMIIANLVGGLGNQMFQYAAGRAAAQSRGEMFYIDLSDFFNYGLHNGYELSKVFHLDVATINKESLSKPLRWQTGKFLGKFFRQPFLSSLRSRSFVVEPQFNYWPNLQNIPSPLYLRGYWQTEKYFKVHESLIREDFSFRNKLSGLNKELSDLIHSSESVAIHVRRGDYISDPKTAKVLATQDLNYYKKAVNYISSKISQPSYFIFSDDAEWVKENLNFLPNVTIVSHNRGVDSHFDMQLMSLCQHNIIANSSFSWWGAWLNSNASKIVVAPKRWFVNGINDVDLVPAEWVRF